MTLSDDTNWLSLSTHLQLFCIPILIAGLLSGCVNEATTDMGIPKVVVDPSLLTDSSAQTTMNGPGRLAAPPSTGNGGKAASASAELSLADHSLTKRAGRFQDALSRNQPILLLEPTSLTATEAIAQEVAVRNPQFSRFVYQGREAIPLHNEIMGVRPALPSDLDQEILSQCTPERCYRVEMYNYAYNLTTVALVDVVEAVVLNVSPFLNTQPDIPQHLIDLAIEIAINAPEVIEELGFQPEESEATMPNIKTALNSTRCERSRHLCVAPTFLVEDRALWAIVDLTDERLVGVRWTDLGTNSTEPAITEESLQNEVVSTLFCEQSTELTQDGWQMEYMLTSSDGLRISNVRFNGKQVMANAKLVDWHVSYSQSDGFGYSDAVGCPIFSSAAVIAYNGPQIIELLTDVSEGASEYASEDTSEGGEIVGFALVQDFVGDGWPMPCHYRYEQRYEFYRDGRFRIGGANHGRGCGTDGVYRPVLRIDITAEGNGRADSIAEWQNGGWSTWETEQWALQNEQTLYTPDGYQYRITGETGLGYLVEPSNGQFGDGSRGDNAYLYATRRHPDQDEGEADLVTIGSCCNTDHEQGPEQFMQPAEPIASTDLILWYVAQLPNDDTLGQEYCWADAIIEAGKTVNRSYPCYFGPMFTPITLSSDSKS
ncbi:MAG: hypothetical protein AAF702_40325 [Chloroflexota bacterium]